MLSNLHKITALSPPPLLIIIILINLLTLTPALSQPLTIIELLELLGQKYHLYPPPPPLYIKTPAYSTNTEIIEKDSLSQATKSNTLITTHSFEPLPCDQVIETNQPSVELLQHFTYCEVIKHEDVYHIKPKVLYTSPKEQKILTQEEAANLYKLLTTKKTKTKILYPLIPNPEFYNLCINNNAECLPTKDFFIVKSDDQTLEELKQYAIERKPTYRIQAIIVLLSQNAKNQLSLNLNLNLSQAKVPKFQELKVEPNLTLYLQGGIFSLEAQIRALQEKKEASILSMPKLIVTAWEEGQILTGQEIPYITPATANIPATVSFKSAYLSLKIKIEPTIENKARVKLILTKDTPNYAINKENPPIETTRLETVLNTTLPTTLYLGGIKEQTQAHARKKNLFIPTKEEENQERELYIFLSIEEEND